jgi:hypothetical protein
MRGVQVQIPEKAKRVLEDLNGQKDSALDMSRSVQGRLNALPDDADPRLRERITAERDKYIQKHSCLLRLTSSIQQYLFQLRLPPGYVLEMAPPPDIQIKTTTLKAIEATRARIAECTAEIARTRALPLKHQSRQLALATYLARLAQRVRPRIGFDQRGNARVQWASEDFVTREDILGAIVWALGPLGPAQLVEAFEIEQEPEPENAVSPEEREQQISKFTNTLLALERQEEFLIERAAEEGTEITRRPDANPMAVLQLQIVAQEAAASAAA